jgi:hypothetical protein
VGNLLKFLVDNINSHKFRDQDKNLKNKMQNSKLFLFIAQEHDRFQNHLFSIGVELLFVRELRVRRTRLSRAFLT